MAFANLSDIVATTIEKRSRKIANNVRKQNAVLSWMEKRGNVQPFSGGSLIIQEFSFQENGNFGWYSGNDQLPTAAQDVISGATFTIKQCAAPVVFTGLEELQNAGDEQMIDLVQARLAVAEDTMANNMSSAVYSDGTGFGGKIITGLSTAVAANPTIGVYGGVDRSIWPFWRNQFLLAGNQNAAIIQNNMTQLYAKCSRGPDVVDLIVADNNMWVTYNNSLQVLQRFVSPKKAELGFRSLEFLGADVVLDGGIGGFAPANTMYFLNTKYIFLRPHKKRDMVALTPGRRVAANQDARVEILAWAGNLCSNGAQFQGYFQGF